MMITLKNNFLTVEIDDLGAQLCSVKNAAGTEYIWQADPAVWGRHAPLLFPVIGRLQGSQYTHNGTTYSIPAHGFARDSLFSVVDQSDCRVSLRLTHSQETLAVYPFPFTLTVTYTLDGTRLEKACTVENTGEAQMLYELGGHDGFVAPLDAGETMADYAILVPGVDVLHPYGMNEQAMLTPKGPSWPLEQGRIPLKPSTYSLDTIILDQLQGKAMLVNKEGKARVTMDFTGFPYLGLWTQDMPADTNYVCIEPWTTLPDGIFVGRALADKQGIRTLEAGQSETLTYTTTFD